MKSFQDTSKTPDEEKSSTHMSTATMMALGIGASIGAVSATNAGHALGQTLLPPAASVVTRGLLGYVIPTSTSLLGQITRSLIIECNANLAFSAMYSASGYATGLVCGLGGGVAGYLLTAEAIIIFHTGFTYVRAYNASIANRLLNYDTNAFVSVDDSTEGDGFVIVNHAPSRATIELIEDSDSDNEDTVKPTRRPL